MYKNQLSYTICRNMRNVKIDVLLKRTTFSLYLIDNEFISTFNRYLQ